MIFARGRPGARPLQENAKYILVAIVLIVATAVATRMRRRVAIKLVCQEDNGAHSAAARLSDAYIYVTCNTSETVACAEAEREKVEEELIELRAEIGEDAPPTITSHCDGAAHHCCLLRQIEELKDSAQQLRRIAGERHCRQSGVGATGGFCLELDAAGAALPANYKTDEQVAARLAVMFRGQTVVDLGCGIGGYGKHFLASNAGIRWVGYDGAANVESATAQFVRHLDLSRSAWLGRRFNWVLSLEVGEHVPAKFEAIFLDNIVRHAAHGVVLSWAIPGQGGSNHVNVLPNAQVIAQMQRRGFAYDEEVARQLRSSATFSWFKNTIMVFRRGQM